MLATLRSGSGRRGLAAFKQPGMLLERNRGERPRSHASCPSARRPRRQRQALPTSTRHPARGSERACARIVRATFPKFVAREETANSFWISTPTVRSSSLPRRRRGSIWISSQRHDGAVVSCVIRFLTWISTISHSSASVIPSFASDFADLVTAMLAARFA